MGSSMCFRAQEVPYQYEVFKEGWLNNKSSFVDGNYPKWVVLSRTPAGILAFKDEKRRSEECFIYFCLQDVDFSYDTESKILYFKRLRGEKESWSFNCSNKDYDEWKDAIEEVIRTCAKKSSFSIQGPICTMKKTNLE
jgi:hypothetical protein